MLIRKYFFIGCLCLLAAVMSSCSRAPLRTVILPPQIPPPVQTVPVTPDIVTPGPRANLVHIVGPGETVWRIGKMYDVSIDDIVRANNLRNADSLKKGQKLDIPHAAPLKPVITLYPSTKWKYIIIHHSATDAGSALGFDKSHQQRGFNGLGYHFVIGNGTSNRDQGQIETSPRWTKQEDGAHCKAGHMNCQAIGICLVGNFSKGNVSKKQLDSLVYLVNKLRKYYNIPKSNIMGHGQVKGAKTECPGTNFPWKEFRNRL